MTIQQDKYVYDLQHDVWEKLMIDDTRELDGEGRPLRKIAGTVINAERGTPIVARLNFFARTLFWNLFYLGSVDTNTHGQFTFLFKDSSGCYPELITLDIGVVAINVLFPEKGINAFYEEKSLGILRVTSQKVHQDCGKLVVKSLHEGTFQARLLKPGRTKSDGTFNFFNFIKNYPKLLYAKVNLEKLTVESIRNIFVDDVNQVTPESRLLWSLINIYNFQKFKIDDKKRIVWKISIREELPENHTMPNVTIVAKNGRSKNLSLEYVTIQYPKDEEVYHIPAESSAIQRGIYTAESLLALKGELEISLGAKRRLLEIVASQFKKYISESNPIFFLMEPFFLNLPDELFTGYEGVLNGEHPLMESSCLTKKERSSLVAAGVIDEVKQLYSEPHDNRVKYSGGKIEKEFYKSVKIQVLKFINHHHANIKMRYWGEVYDFSLALMKECEQIAPITRHPLNPEDDDEDKLASILTWSIISMTWGKWMTNVRRALFSDPKRTSFVFGFNPSGNGGEFDGYGNLTKEEVVSYLYQANTFGHQKTDTFIEDLPTCIVRGVKRVVNEYAKKFDHFYIPSEPKV